MRFIPIMIAMAAALAVAPARAGQRVVIVDQAGLEPAVRGVFQKELALLIGHRHLRFRWSSKAQVADGEIRLAIQPGIFTERPEALGLARLERGKVAPDLAVFPDAIAARLANPSSCAMLGRALARVASHEVIHYLEQSPGHHANGLMREFFSSDELASDDPAPFRRVSLGR